MNSILSICLTGLASAGPWLLRRSPLSWHRSAIRLYATEKCRFPYWFASDKFSECNPDCPHVTSPPWLWLKTGKPLTQVSPIIPDVWQKPHCTLHLQGRKLKDSNKTRDEHAKEITRTGQPLELILTSYGIP